MTPMRIGVIGCGMVSHAYLGTIARTPGLELAALASRTMASAEAQAARYGGTATTVEALLADPDIDIMVNLAPPATHYELCRAALLAGKHVYCEKPLATSLDDARDLVSLAEDKGLAIGCAPDTFLGEGHQAARRLVDEGSIGTVTGGTAFFGTRGMESWHPNPAFFFARGGGPLLDIGPYYVTQLVNLLGPIAEVVAIGTMPRAERAVTTPGREGETITVAVPTSVTGALLFERGANISIALSWDVAAHQRPPLELYGDAGTMIAPDPNQFAGAVRVSADGSEWTVRGEEVPPRKLDAATLARALQAMGRGIDPLTDGEIGPETALRSGDRRGLGLVDMAGAIAEGRAPRASGQLACHVLEVLLALEASAEGASRIAIASRVDRPEPVA
jgi:predicted dehydrogenase